MNEEKSIFPLITRKRAEKAVPLTDCSGKKYEDWLREDIIRYVQEGAEIQRDYDEMVIIEKLVGTLKEVQWKYCDIYQFKE